MNCIGQKVITDFDGKVNPVFKTFLINRFETLNSFVNEKDDV